MFDPVTASLIARAPALDGLNLEELPKRLTEAFADIVSARVRLRGAPAGGSSESLLETLGEMRHLAAAHEAFVALLPERENRGAAAFVAASAHQVCLFGAHVAEDGEAISSHVDGAAVSPDVCATLLFLVAEAHADAAEASKRIAFHPNATDVEKALLTAIRLLAIGRLAPITAMEAPVIIAEELSGELAVQALLLELFKGVRNLAAQLQRRVDLMPEAGGVEDAATFFRRVKSLCIEELDGIFEKETAYSIYPGPLHLANLLLAVDRDLIGSAISRIPTPNGVEETGWWQIIRRMSRRRPYLWPNHREAISQGYLEQGISSAISFPTGGGKSTLAELKIATALLRDEKVVFLVPTHALVDQTTRALKDTFQTFEIVGDTDEEFSFSDILILPEVVVTTPERCLMLLSIQPEAFAGLGLIVFDECHLLHPRDTERSRRSVDAMLAILNLTLFAPSADLLLLSAMMKNADEVSQWIETMTGRPCLPLNVAWKPTRQVRGSVVYPAARIAELNEQLRVARIANPTQQGAPAKIRRQMHAQPHGLFCLLQTWTSTNREDYALLPLLADEHLLSTSRAPGGRWYLTPNGNQTSAAIAAAAASAGMKTLVFVQTIPLAESSSARFRDLMNAPVVTLNDEEMKLHELAAEEMGGAAHCYLELEGDGTFRGGAASHHALLLREERNLHELLFKRKGGVDVLFATSTLAQGMNLPSEIVIISGDSRFDPDADKMAQLEAHELLNAAGRAGRAGEGSQGFVLVVPSRVIDFDEENSQINQHWMTLQSIFEQSDQCLVIDDPLTALLDRVHQGVVDGMAAYMLSRLPPSAASDEESPVRVLLNRSFAAFRARQRGDEDWVETRIEAARVAREETEVAENEGWLKIVAGSTGVPVDILRSLMSLVESGACSGTATQAVGALLGWISANPAWLLELVRPENVEGMFGGEYGGLPSNAARGAHAMPVVAQLLPLWMSGAPLKDLEKALIESGNVGRCKRARHFVLRLVPDLSFVAGLPARLAMAKAKQENPDAEIQLLTTLATLGAAVREGCDGPESLAARINCGRSVSRVAARAYYEELVPHIVPGELRRF